MSKSLKLLEAHIGLPLFNRTTRQLELTEAGERLLEGTREAVQSLQYALESVQDMRHVPAGQVRITVARFAYQCILKPWMNAFCQRYPQLELEISIDDGEVDLLADGYDLGIRFGDHLQEGMIARQLLAPFKEGLYVSAGYAEGHGLPQTPEELPRHRLIGYRFITARRILPLILNHQGEEFTVQMPHSIITNDIEVIADGVRQHLGIGRLFEPVHARLPDRDGFIPVLEPYWRRYPGVYLYYLQNSQKAGRIRTVIDFLLEKSGSG
ncbi:MAG: LysR family transcriptional regulator [Thiothrix sp.]|nr:LysR family transcriptional regulator [Thiothrix sp.]HPQ95518.1 LysR substrate-binding domain-containing protein [Thiolinea sp.]